MAAFEKTTDEPGALAARVAGAPQLSAPDTAQQRVDRWLGELGNDPAVATLQRLFAAHPPARALILGLADGSPHLWDLAAADPARLVRVLETDPDTRFDTIIADAVAAIAASRDEATVMARLRRMKAEASLTIALADIGGVWPVTRVVAALTELADAAVGAAVHHLLGQATREGKLRPANPAEPEAGSGYIVLAMGKMGAGELNYSSDIDLIVFYDARAGALAPGSEPAPFYVRITRGLVKLLQERTADGYVFRTDLRLRPDPGSTQIAVSTAAALDYYESIGRNWERAAMIKARACAGDIAAGENLLRDLSPFIWRKYLDFAAVADIHSMKRQIHAYRGHGEIAVEGHNVKLGRGGIREIEFFVQTQQLIAGGRHPELRGRETLKMLDVLAEGEWISTDARDELGAAYRFLRALEHRLQMVADEQTHTLPGDREGLERFARFFGFADRDGFAETLLGHLRNVQRQYATLFESAPAAEARARALAFPADADDRETLDKLTGMGFKQPLEASARVRQWLSGAYRSLRGEHSREQLAELVPLLLTHFARSSNPDAALLAFDRFLAGLHGAGRLFSLLRQNPDLIALIAMVLGTAPRLADSLAQFPDVIDAVVDPSFFGALPEEAELTAALKRSVSQSGSYEDFLDRIRIFAQEQMFLIGTRILSGTVSAEQAGEAFARLADMLVRSLHRAVEDEFTKLHGRIAAQEVAILALGKLGGREMTATSDLDLIVIYDFDTEHPESDGPRPLYGAQYFTRLVQRLISALTAPTNYGVLYQVDMRLRPSGRAGPVATRIDSFAGYQETEAWTWEHMALTRARVVSASPAFRARIEAAIASVLGTARNAELIAGDVTEMRQAIAREKGEDDRWNLKHAAGGLVDIEFIAQYLQLVHGAATPELLDTSTIRVLDKAWRLGLLPTEHAEVLRPAVRLYHNLTQILRLCLPGDFDAKTAAPGLSALLARAADVPDFATLEAFIAETETKVRRSFERILEASV
ncbi:MAG: bifunctional [glutamine synthetase] adenylyltransferase/[glutamine synthetase]-adenylyl-L-tyrosine phosphorylase [Xanthobacteraceae bacterium]|nr:bifunctional [glutamine synthetase] adenylyltransferase/[glutamine synthetase]-adenylyl-L-tyrosine phosphorylase [Xanthobacteraceae bacterium]